MMPVGFVFTNYDNARYTRGAVASLHAQASVAAGDVRVVIVDNASRADDVAALRAIAREFPGTELLLQDRNLGYFPGLNVGIRHLRRAPRPVAHMVVGNNDLEFPPDFVLRVREHAEVLERWAVVAPDLVAPDGQHQNPHVLRPIGRARRAVWDVYFGSYAAARLVGAAARATRRFTVREENARGSRLHERAGPIEQGYGACYLLGPEFFRHFEALCAPTFLMQEEFFLQEQLRLIGQQTYYDPRFVVRHHHHATMGAMPGRRHWELSRASHLTYKRYLAMDAAARATFIRQHAAVPA